MVKSIKVLSPEEELSHGQVSVTVVKWQFLTKGRGSMEAQEKRYPHQKKDLTCQKISREWGLLHESFGCPETQMLLSYYRLLTCHAAKI